MLTINLQYIPDPLPYLRKQKLRALALLPDNITDARLITPLGVTHDLGTMSNLELVKIIQELIDVTCDATTIWCEQRSMYIRH
jgi:hypothetical protein